MHPALRMAYQRARNVRADIATGVVVAPKIVAAARALVPPVTSKIIPRRHQAKLRTYRPRYDPNYERAWCQIICGVTPDPRGLALSADFAKLREIKEAVCENFSLRPEVLLSERRQKELVHARQIVMYLAKNNTSRSLPEIGRWLGNRDHTTVLHGVRSIENKRQTDPDIAARVVMLERRLGFTGEKHAGN